MRKDIKQMILRN